MPEGRWEADWLESEDPVPSDSWSCGSGDDGVGDSDGGGVSSTELRVEEVGESIVSGLEEGARVVVCGKRKRGRGSRSH